MAHISRTCSAHPPDSVRVARRTRILQTQHALAGRSAGMGEVEIAVDGNETLASRKAAAQQLTRLAKWTISTREAGLPVPVHYPRSHTTHAHNAQTHTQYTIHTQTTHTHYSHTQRRHTQTTNTHHKQAQHAHKTIQSQRRRHTHITNKHNTHTKLYNHKGDATHTSQTSTTHTQNYTITKATPSKK